jgi:methionyl-tRNA formyltransferase
VSKNSLCLAFAGTPAFAAAILDNLIQHKAHEIKLVITGPDKPSGRGRKTVPGPVKQLALKNGLPVRAAARTQELDPEKILAHTDVLVVAAFGLILPEDILSRPRLGSINVHTSLLPRWRGAAPIQRAILAGDSSTGITVMQMDAGLDSGPVLLQRDCSIEPEDTGGSLHDKLARLGGACLLEVLDRLAAGSITPRRQDDSRATYAHKISREDTALDWNQNARNLERKVRAFNPAPVARATLQGRDIRVWEAGVVKADQPGAPGSVIRCSADGIVIATAQDALRITRLQLPGKKPITAREFMNGYPGLLQTGLC